MVSQYSATSANVTPIIGHHVGHTTTFINQNPSSPGVYGVGVGAISLSVPGIYTLCSRRRYCKTQPGRILAIHGRANRSFFRAGMAWSVTLRAADHPVTSNRA